ncbi:MAG TPA: hypothetical protein VEB19_04160 [Gemmatimonadaceae bacterium]|nr:hypothetical protein [Gemmatimonadaceae bacterium]
MYATCLFCHGRLGTNEAVEHFPVGRRLAFDAARGRLWVVCDGCGRWNLSPLDERWEAIEDCERQFRATRVRVTTDHIGLARLSEGCELIRIGKPLRPEFAAWRYGSRFGTRRTRAMWATGAAGVAVVASGAVFAPLLGPALVAGAWSIIIVPGLTSAMGVVPVVGALALRDYVQHDRVVARLVARNTQFATARPRVYTVRAKHTHAIQLDVRGRDPASVSLAVPHETGWAQFEGIEAMQAASVILAGANRFGAGAAQVQDAVNRVEELGDSANFLRAASSLGGARSSRLTSLLNVWRRLGTMHLSSTECLALEMSLHEESERRVLEGELALLEAAWRDAEQIAAVADRL